MRQVQYRIETVPTGSGWKLLGTGFTLLDIMLLRIRLNDFVSKGLMSMCSILEKNQI